MMIDKILAYKDDMPENTYNEILNEALTNKDARILFMLAYYVKNVDIAFLEEKILDTNNLRYISFFMRSIPNIDKDKFVSKVLKLGRERDAYYCMFDNRDLNDNQIFRLIDKSKSEQKYYFLSVYHYFITLNRYDDMLFDKVKVDLKKLNIDINEDNYKEILENLKEEKFNKMSYDDNKGFSKNCYVGRKDYIPDMIVLHSTPSFVKGVNNFYDETKEVSAHFIINTDGDVKQIVSLDDSAWANGTSLNQDSDVYYRFAKNEIVKNRDYNANYYTFSIEHVSVDGELTDEQYASSKEVIKKIIKYIKDKYDYDFIIDDKHIVGHRDVNPIVRTVCPGNKFPMDRIIKELQEEI